MSAESTHIQDAAAHAAQHIAVQLMKEGGRGAVLLGAARLDLSLENLLRALMHPHAGGDDNLFASDRPLGTFSSKIALSFRLGLIDKSVEHSLQMIRRVRNDFAHSFEDASLADQAHKNRLSKPLADARKSPLWKALETILATHGTHLDVELRDYICLVVVLVSFTEAVTHMLSPIKPAMHVRFFREE